MLKINAATKGMSTKERIIYFAQDVAIDLIVLTAGVSIGLLLQKL